MRRRNKNVPIFWGGPKPPRKLLGDLYFRASTCLKKLGLGGWNLQAVNCLNVNWKSPFHAEPRQLEREPKQSVGWGMQPRLNLQPANEHERAQITAGHEKKTSEGLLGLIFYSHSS